MGDRAAVPLHARRRAPFGRLAAVAAVAALAAGSGTHAWWSAKIQLEGETLTTGDLQLTMLDGATWRQDAPWVEDVDAAGGALDTLDDFVAMPGDVIEVVLPVSTVLRGDNMRGGFHTVLDDTQAIEDGRVRVGFHVETRDGTQVAPASGEAPYGQVLTVPGLVGDPSGLPVEWNVVVRVHVLGDYAWSDEIDTDTAAWAAGQVDVRLQQVRSAPGDTPAVES